MNTTTAHGAARAGEGAHAFDPAGAATPAKRRRWPWVLLALALLALVTVLSLGAMVWHEVQASGGLAGAADWHIGIDEHGWHGDGGFAAVVAALTAALVSVLVLVVVVPLVLLGAGLVVGLSLALATFAMLAMLGLLLGGAALVLLVATFPLWALALLLWWALKPRRPAVASAPAH